MERDKAIQAKVVPKLLEIENLLVLGNNKLHKVPIFSFLIKSINGKVLHPYFVTTLLNDIFGI